MTRPNSLNSTGRLVLWTGFIGLLIALAYAGRAESGKPDPNVLYQYSTAVSGLISYLVMLAIVLAIAGGSPQLLALARPERWSTALPFALAVFVGIMIVNGALNPFLHAGEEQGLTPSGWDASRAGQYAANFAIVAVLGPIVEELTYRGLGVSLWRRYGRSIAIVVTALLFGLSHGLVEGLPILTIFGAGLAWLRLRTGSAYPGMLVHGAFNALALIIAVAT